MELSVSSEMTFFNMKLQLKICPQLRTQSSAEDTGRIDTSCAGAQLATGGTCTVCGHPTLCITTYFTMYYYKIVGVAVLAFYTCTVCGHYHIYY